MMNLLQTWNKFVHWCILFVSLSAEEQDHQARGEEAAEGGSEEVNSFSKINFLFSCSSVSSLLFTWQSM